MRQENPAGDLSVTLARATMVVAWLVAVPWLLAGCANLPSPADIRASTILPAGNHTAFVDDRAAFRQTFCALLDRESPERSAADPSCDDLLWRLADEPPPGSPAAPPPLRPDLRVFVIGGAFSDCFGDASLAYREGLISVNARGALATAIPISGRSSARHNAGLIDAALAAADLTPEDDVVLLGYSKGAVDILQFLADFPGNARWVDTVVNVAGPVHGSAVAREGAWAYDALLSGAFAGRCDPGDGGVVDSLLPEVRQAALAASPPPAHVRFYSLLAFTTREHMARGLVPSWRILSAVDARNDGQVAPEEGLLPGSTLLGFANTDHWGLAIDIEQELEFIAGRDERSPFPRAILFEAVLRHVGAHLAAERARD